MASDDWVSRSKLGAEHALVAAYERGLDRAGRILVDMAKLDLDERLVRLNEAQGRLMADVLLAAITRAALPQEWHDPLRSALATELRALPA
jgi:hypothetical protein